MILDIVVACFNPPNFLENLLQSLYNYISDLKEIQVFAIDDCSAYGEDYKKVLNKYNNFFNCFYFKTEKNSGPGNARNLGLKFCSSDYITFIDDDDEIIKDILPFCDKTFGDFSISARNEPNQEICLSLNCINSIQGLMFKREFLIRYNLIFPKHMNLGMEDSVFRTVCLFLGKNINCINEHFYLRNYRDNSNFSAVLNILNANDDIIFFIGCKEMTIWLANCLSYLNQYAIKKEEIIDLVLFKMYKDIWNYIIELDNSGVLKRLDSLSSRSFQDLCLLTFYGIVKYGSENILQNILNYNHLPQVGRELIEFGLKFLKYDKEKELLILPKTNEIMPYLNKNTQIIKYWLPLTSLFEDLKNNTQYYDIESLIKIYGIEYYNSFFENSTRGNQIKNFN